MPVAVSSAAPCPEECWGRFSTRRIPPCQLPVFWSVVSAKVVLAPELRVSLPSAGCCAVLFCVHYAVHVPFRSGDAPLGARMSHSRVFSSTSCETAGRCSRPTLAVESFLAGAAGQSDQDSADPRPLCRCSGLEEAAAAAVVDVFLLEYVLALQAFCDVNSEMPPRKARHCLLSTDVFEKSCFLIGNAWRFIESK